MQLNCVSEMFRTSEAFQSSMEKASILVIDDDLLITRTIERMLQQRAFHVTTAHCGEQGLSLARQHPPDVVILDVLMPEMDGLTVCQVMRHDPRLKHIPILFLTARIKLEERLECFSVGGDDYLAKPFSLEELFLRLQAILRRTREVPRFLRESSEEDENACLKVGNFSLNTRTYELSTPHRGIIRLSPRQYDLLYHLMSHPGECFSAARLLDEIWDYPSDRGSPDLVRMHIKTLRERVEVNPRSPQFIITLPGKGYTVAPSSVVLESV